MCCVIVLVFYFCCWWVWSWIWSGSGLLLLFDCWLSVWVYGRLLVWVLFWWLFCIYDWLWWLFILIIGSWFLIFNCWFLKFRFWVVFLIYWNIGWFSMVMRLLGLLCMFCIILCRLIILWLFKCCLNKWLRLVFCSCCWLC